MPPGLWPTGRLQVFIYSFMFQVLSEYLTEYHKSKPLDQIYTMVTDTVAEKCHHIRNNDYKHIPQKLSTLRKSLFLTSEPEIRVCIKPVHPTLCHPVREGLLSKCVGDKIQFELYQRFIIERIGRVGLCACY